MPALTGLRAEGRIKIKIKIMSKSKRGNGEVRMENSENRSHKSE
jgi:hypothetical protein